MALADLDLKLKACFKNNCTTIEFLDNTQAYNAITNPGGWNGSPVTIGAGAIEIATIDYKHYSEPSFNRVDVLSALIEDPDNITGAFILAEEIISTGDGLYTFIYSVDYEGSPGAKTITCYQYSLCNVRCCIDKMWLKLTSINCPENWNKDLLEKIRYSEGLYKAIGSIAKMGNYTLANEYLAKLQRICSLEKCNCGN